MTIPQKTLDAKSGGSELNVTNPINGKRVKCLLYPNRVKGISLRISTLSEKLGRFMAGRVINICQVGYA